MPTTVPEFRFAPLSTVEFAPRDRVVSVRSGVRQKRRLLGILSRGLGFPDWFGWNWDALSDCLTDLSFVPEESRVVLIHLDVPFIEGSNSRRTYLEILRDSVRERPDRIVVVFPESAAAAVTAAMGSSS